MYKLFIDGRYGVAGYSLLEKIRPLTDRGLIELIQLDKERTKDINTRYAAIKESDITVLCLPEEIASKTCEDLKDVNTIIIDASTYHRTLDGWTYGYPELNITQLELIKKSKRIANPGCFANGILTLLNPIKDCLKDNYPININGVTGYSAGGKHTVDKQKENPLNFRITNLNREHIHLKEIKHWLNLTQSISFIPSVSSFERGQVVSINLFKEQLNISIEQTILQFKSFYNQFGHINIIENSSHVIPEHMAGRDDVELYINKIGEYLQIHAVYDNLGRGSSGSILNIINNIIS